MLNLIVSQLAINQPDLPANPLLHTVFKPILLNSFLFQNLGELVGQRCIKVPLHPSLWFIFFLFVSFGLLNSLLHIVQLYFEAVIDLPVLRDNRINVFANFSKCY
jgi:hypothetical protein